MNGAPGGLYRAGFSVLVLRAFVHGASSHAGIRRAVGAMRAIVEYGSVGLALNSAEHAAGKGEERADEFKGAADYDADETEWQEDEPDERIEDERGEGKGPAKEGEETEEQEV